METATVLLLSLISLVSGANIVIVHPLYSGSHVLTLRSLAESLTQRGHNVHVLRWRDMHFIPSVTNSNITESILSVNNEDGRWTFLTREKEAAFKMPYEILWNSGLSYNSILEAGSEAFPLMETHCSTLLSNAKLMQKLKSMNFELAIVDIIYNECSLVLLHHLSVPAVGYWAFPFASGEADYTTAFLPPSHIPAFMSRMTDRMSFKERVLNVLMKVGSHVTMQTHCYFLNRAVQSHLPGAPYPCDLIADLSGMLINTDYAMDYPRLLPPTFINVGGMQIRSPKPLTHELEEWMESSGEHGVVLFTMGFIFSPKIVPKRLVTAFMDAFSRFPQKFLVKFEGPLDHIPPNVKVLEWMPQQDILAHPKTRVFLTHCGLHGVMESIYYGVPMVGMPIFIDQGDALIKMEALGIALGLDKETATSDEIYTQLHRVLTEPEFKGNATRLSALMRDVKEPPLERAIDLINFLIRHKGAPHLKLSSRNLNFIQYFSLDAIFFLLILICATTYLQYRMYKKLLPLLLAAVRMSRNSLRDKFLTHSPRMVPKSGGGGTDCNNNNLGHSTYTSYFRRRTQDSHKDVVIPPTITPISMKPSNGTVSNPWYNLRHHSANSKRSTVFPTVVNKDLKKSSLLHKKGE